MLNLLCSLLSLLRSSFKTHRALQLEIVALRHQLGILQRSFERKRPRFQNSDRLLWVWLSRFWSGWRQALVIIRPKTVVAWHRMGFRLYWRWKSRTGRPGRPAIQKEVRDLIRNMSQANPLWGAPRIHGELLKLGIEIAETTVGKYMVRFSKPPSQTWRAFMNNHLEQMVAVDFFVVPTVTFRILFVFVVLAHERRRVVHFNVTAHPTARWTAQQLTEAFPWDTAPRFLLRDRDRIYGKTFRQRVAEMGTKEVLITPRSPWQSPYVERLIGSIRRECLNHFIVFNESGLRRILRSYFDYYQCSRTHLALEKDAPEPRTTHPPESGNVVALPILGGLHHRYERRAA